MKGRFISKDVCCLCAGVKADGFFEGIWPIPHGVSLNAYAVKAKKTALIDLVRNWTDAPKQIEEGLSSVGLALSQIDCLVINNLEPDHAGWIREFRRRNHSAEIVATRKGCDLIRDLYKVENGLRLVRDGDSLDLGGGRVLTFFETPSRNWPGAMATWDSSSGTFFSGDAFGSFGAQGDRERIFDDEFDEGEHAFFEKECLRYYANIFSPFPDFAVKLVQKMGGLNIKCVAPSHGIVWRLKPREIIDRYLKYASWAKGPAEKAVTAIWGSMYGNTETGLSAVIEGIEAEGVPCAVHRVPDEDVSWVLADAYRSAGLVIAMPTCEGAMFPPMSHALDMLRRKQMRGKKALRIGSRGWSGGAEKDYRAAIEGLKWQGIESYEWPGHPSEKDLEALRGRGRELARLVAKSRA